MIKVENVETYGWEVAIRGMRNPLNSWNKSDSEWIGFENWDCGHGVPDGMGNAFVIGRHDIDLMKRLYKGGTEHRKYLRMITVTMDITAPLYWWKEFDTYKVGTVCNSCSTMHKIHAKEFVLDDFSHEQLDYTSKCMLKDIISVLNKNRELFINAKNKQQWWNMIQLLPTSYNQRRTIQMNYENVMSMIKQRENHKLDEWRQFVDLLKELPYVEEIRE